MKHIIQILLIIPLILTIGCEDEKATESDANVTLWLVEDSAHVDALWEYSSEYESRLVSFFTNSLEFKS